MADMNEYAQVLADMKAWLGGTSTGTSTSYKNVNKKHSDMKDATSVVHNGAPATRNEELVARGVTALQEIYALFHFRVA